MSAFACHADAAARPATGATATGAVHVLPPIPSPGGYLRLRRVAAMLTVEDVAQRLATEPRLAEHGRAQWLRLIEAGVQPATISTLIALQQAFRFDMGVLAAIAANDLGRGVPVPDICVHCGCSDADPCVYQAGGGQVMTCGWADDDKLLCTDCAQALRAGRPTPAQQVAA